MIPLLRVPLAKVPCVQAAVRPARAVISSRRDHPPSGASPQIRGGTVVDQPMHMVDVYPTLADLAGAPTQVAPAGAIEDVDGSYRQWFADHGIAVALMRPDFHVFGSAAAVNGAGKLVAALRSVLGSAGSWR